MGIPTTWPKLSICTVLHKNYFPTSSEILGEKGRDLSQSYGKSPYTNQTLGSREKAVYRDMTS